MTTPFYTAADEHFGCPTPAYHPDLTPCTTEEPCGCGPDAAWACNNCGGKTVAGRFCVRCEAMIAEDVGLVSVTVPNLAACRSGVQL